MIKYDFPVRYIPATEITPNSPLKDLITSSPWEVRVNTIIIKKEFIIYIIYLPFVFESYTKNGIGCSLSSKSVIYMNLYLKYDFKYIFIQN